MINNKLLDRITSSINNEDLIDSLVNNVSFTDLKSLFLEVYNKKVKKLEYKDIAEQYKRNRFVKPSNTSPKRLCEIDLLAFSLASDEYMAIELSPVSPLGCASVLSTVNQNNIVTTTRNFEVCSDLTNVLALECAEKRRNLIKNNKNSNDKIKLCASHRLLRAQPFSNPNSFAHFRLFGLCTAGRDEGNYLFEEESIIEHVSYYIKLIEQLILMDYKFNSIEVALVMYNQRCEELAKRITGEIEYSSFSIDIKVSRIENFNKTYYTDIGFHIFGINISGEKLLLVDGGLTDWTQKLLSSNKERLMISGIGTERLVHCFS